MMPPLLTVNDLHVRFVQSEQIMPAVKGVSFSLEKGKTLGLVGESGSGKSLTALSILRLLPDNAELCGHITVNNTSIVNASDAQIRQIRGHKVSMIFQEPMTALNPLHTIERQINETLMLHLGMPVEAATKRTLELLELVGIKQASSRMTAYPHELSGGQRQRVMIAMALACEPELLIADEPTTALDVTVQRQILMLLKALQKKLGMAILFISHDLNLIQHVADTICVMKDGVIVESNNTEALFQSPQHAYTRELLNAEPTGEPAPLNGKANPVLACENLSIWFPVKRGLLKRTIDHVKAVTDISMSLKKGETLGIVGESGSGKTTLGLALLKLLPAKGHIVFHGQNVAVLSQKAYRPLREKAQIVFQDPYGSLSPRMTVADIIGEGLDIHHTLSDNERSGAIESALRDVGLEPACMSRYPHEFSGGQRQRIAIARAIVLRPTVIVLDEPTSALDRTVQSQIITLLRALQQKYQLSYLFISHDLAVVKAMSHRIIVMRAGRIVDEGQAGQLFQNPKHPYTQRLIDSAF
ncbi:ABC transporter ATP-binding protein [Candidatus Sororendozoicomonas aggregata]|uniref:ABC transporter ATP-binding protein n=1 Tax=Candidatus Sororendozoicomonas aggregata TaxID=3073239 RepID=UPI002ED4EBB3